MKLALCLLVMVCSLLQGFAGECRSLSNTSKANYSTLPIDTTLPNEFKVKSIASSGTRWDTLPFFHLKRIAPNVKGGLDYWQGDNRTNLLGGVGIDYRLSKHWSLLAEAHFKEWGEIEDPDYISYFRETHVNPRGRNLYSYTDTIKLLRFWEFPVVGQYHLSHRFAIQAGLSFNLVYNRANTKDRSISGGFFFGRTTERGVSSGIRGTDVSLLLGARYYLLEEFAIELRYAQGLFDLSYDEWFQNEVTHLNNSIQLTIRYYPWP